MAHQFWFAGPPCSHRNQQQQQQQPDHGLERSTSFTNEDKSMWNRAPMASLEYVEDGQSPSNGNTLHDTLTTMTASTTTQRNEKEGSTSPAIPALVHMPLSRQVSPTPGLRYRNLGKSGLRVSNVGLGTWMTLSSQVSDETAEEILVLAYESGINVFDLSEAYCGPRAEILLGRILRQRAWKRSTFVVITKIYWSHRSDERGLSRKHIIETVKGSLERLQLDYIDVVLIHRADPMCPMEEVVRAMDHVIRQGWVMYWGTSRWSAVEISEAYNNCRQFNCPTPICEQVEYQFLYRDKVELSLPEMYNKLGVGLMTWSPASIGFIGAKGEETLPGYNRLSFKKKYSTAGWPEDEATSKENSPWLMPSKCGSEDTPRHASKLRDLAALAERLGCTATQLSIAWSLKNEHVQSVLIGALTPEQLYENLQALQLVPKLTAPVLLEVERILENKPVRPPMVSTLAMR